MEHAVLTLAAPNQRGLPLQPLIGRDGREQTALSVALDEAASAGVRQACLVVHAGDGGAFGAAAADAGLEVRVVEQAQPRGYGHALRCAAEFTEGQPFLHLVGDHLWVSESAVSCARQLVAIAEQEDAAVSAVQPTRETMLPYYGVVGGKRLRGSRTLYQVELVREKPTPTLAEQELLVPGLRTGHYLCFFGMHVFTDTVMQLLGEDVAMADGGVIPLSPALHRLAQRESYLAAEIAGRRHDLGVRFGPLYAQLALALDGAERDEVLVALVELLTQSARGSGAATAQ